MDELEQLKQQWQAANEAYGREPSARTIGRLEIATANAQTAALLSIAKSMEKLATAMDYNGGLVHVLAFTTKDI